VAHLALRSRKNFSIVSKSLESRRKNSQAECLRNRRVDAVEDRIGAGTS
jgi:hypothetical protein